MTIPKTLHITWVGDESRRPDNCIQTRADRNPGWTVKLWGNDDLANYGWYNARRRHSAIGYLSPLQYEHQQARQANQPALQAA